jgi:elongation factor 3
MVLSTAADAFDMAKVKEGLEACTLEPAVAALFEKLGDSAADLVATVKAACPGSETTKQTYLKLIASLDDGSADVKKAALGALKALAQEGGSTTEGFCVTMGLPAALDLCSDKDKAVKEAAFETCEAIEKAANAYAVKAVFPILFKKIEETTPKTWETRQQGLALIGAMARANPESVRPCVPDLIPVVSSYLFEMRAPVKAAARDALAAICEVLNNKDLEPFIPVLIATMADPAQTPDCVHKLAATTFVQTVEAPVLSLVAPILLKGLRDRTTAIKRKTAVIIENMAKLVEQETEAAPFLPVLLPELQKNSDSVSDPECRSVTQRAQAELSRVGGAGQVKAREPAKVPHIVDMMKKQGITGPEPMLEYSAMLLCAPIDSRVYVPSIWHECVVPYVAGSMEADAAKKATSALLDAVAEELEKAEVDEQENEEGEDLCNATFSLAYGAKILLNRARLHLKTGKRYGLCGANGCGKSTLMRAIANGQLEGFPPPEELKTVYVEHDIDGADIELSAVDFIISCIPTLAREEVVNMLDSINFTEELKAKRVDELSGGWKMKLALARAILDKADILLLDEPTNHLDVKNVAWLEGWLNSQDRVSSLIVSHDSGFLDNVCTNIIHYRDRKLKNYIGNLSAFVKRVPEAQSYYELGAAQLKFTFPKPGYLEGVKNRDKALIKLNNAQFTYPGSNRINLHPTTLQVSMASRVAVTGPNGAGKSTLIKLVTGETVPCEGTVWKYPHIRMAYVAQHAFHHVEYHLDKTPNQYIRWRYETGEDREDIDKVTAKLTEEEEKLTKAPFMIAGVKKGVIDKIISRRKAKNAIEYEVTWEGINPAVETSWIAREKLEKCGFKKICDKVDAKEAARLAMAARPLTSANVEKHLSDFGLEPEFGTHSHIRGLSGGQKVKLVVAAAMWNCPHLLILDEPTNYLDREALGAMAGAINEYEGGVVCISHNREFCNALFPEKWMVEDAKATFEGQIWGKGKTSTSEKIEWKPEEETVDALGNTVKVQKVKKKLSNKEKKKAKKIKEARRARGEEVTDTEDEEDWDA